MNVVNPPRNCFANIRNLLALYALITLRFSARSSTLEEFAPHFSTSVQIVWAAPTNNLPAKLWVYKKRPEIFSRAVISNAIVLGSLQNKGFPKPSTNRICWDLDNCPCGHPCTFSVEPDDGTISYSLPGFRNGAPADLPSDEALTKRAWECAFQLGVDRTQLVFKEIAGNFCQYDERGRLVSNNVCGRRISFARRIDGWDCYSDNEGFLIELGNHGQIRSFSLMWPRLEPNEIHHVISPQQMIASIRAFRTILSPNQEEDHYFERLKNLAGATKVVITKVTPLFGEGEFGVIPRGNEPVIYVAPFAELEMRGELVEHKYEFPAFLSDS